ncbi:MAG: hypothetical protein GF403_05500 [Candidatus Coatesbacteria bacterium]|nr:hypothetical protein [Candidatus Coatesbacteria bacterium]
MHPNSEHLLGEPLNIGPDLIRSRSMTYCAIALRAVTSRQLFYDNDLTLCFVPGLAGKTTIPPVARRLTLVTVQVHVSGSFQPLNSFARNPWPGTLDPSGRALKQMGSSTLFEADRACNLLRTQVHRPMRL